MSESDRSLFLDILLEREELDVPQVLMGGFAATLYGIIRATCDTDFVVDLNEAHLQALSSSLRQADAGGVRTARHAGSSFASFHPEFPLNDPSHHGA